MRYDELTISFEEFKCMYSDSMKKYCNMVYDLHRRNRYGISLSKNQWVNIKKVYVYLNAIWGFEENEFLESKYRVFINSNKLQALYSKIRKLN